MTDIREAPARYGGIGSPSGARRIYAQCPYCGRTHTHLEVLHPESTGIRSANCGGGEYRLVFEGETI